MSKAKIICTIGPATESRESLKRLIEEGMNVARLNCSHGNYEEYERIIKIIRQLDSSVGILLDTQGPKIRTGEFEKNTVLKKESTVIIRNKDIIGNKKEFSITYKNLHKDVKKGSSVLIDDGLCELIVEKIKGKDIICKVKNSGPVSSRKGLNFPNSDLSIPGITEKDIKDMKFGISHCVDFIGVSFVREVEDVLKVREILKKNKSDIHIVAKIEHILAVENLDGIIKASDGVMIARGDLGVEVVPEKVPIIQKNIVKMAKKHGKFSIVATQMLNSMIENPRPTRAEVSDVANAVFDRTDAVMLSGETAIGKYPFEAVKIMKRIIKEIESVVKFKPSDPEDLSPSELIAKNAVSAAQDLKVPYIIVPTESGYSAQLVAKNRPSAQIYALVPNETVLRRLSILYGTSGFLVDHSEDLLIRLRSGIKKLIQQKLIRKEDYVVITGSYKSKKTNTLIIHRVENILE